MLNIFRKSINDFADIKIGDIIKCTRCLVKKFGLKFQLISYSKNSDLTIVSVTTIDVFHKIFITENIEDEKKYYELVKTLTDFYSNVKGKNVHPIKPNTSKRPLLKICDLNNIGIFCDMNLIVLLFNLYRFLILLNVEKN